jgi:small subunit ribosomal protein S10
MATLNTEVKIKKPKASARVAAKKPKKSTPVLKKEKKPARLIRAGAEEGKVILRIRVRAYESKILDASVKQIIDTALRYDAEIVGPVPLPTEIKKYTVNRAPFIYKNTREQFEIRVHKRLIDIINPSAKTIESLTNLSLPSGVEIDVKML